MQNLVNNNSCIITKEIADRLNVENSTTVRHLKRLVCTSKLDVSEIGHGLLQPPTQ